MSANKLFVAIRIGAAVAVLTAMMALHAQAATAKPKLTAVATSANPASSSTLSYTITAINATPGPLVAKATITGTKWKATFPVLNAVAVAGTNVVNSAPSATVVIPSNFVGTAKLKVTATLGGKSIGTKTVTFTVVATPPVGAITVTTNLYDVGFENPVTLDGSIVPTSGMSGSLAYTWTQTSGKAVTLSANGVPQTSFSTDALTNFVGMSVGIFVNDVDNFGNTNALFIAPEHRFGTIGGVALDNEQASAAKYGFKLLVSNGSITRTGLFTVACSLQTPAHPNIPLGVSAFFKAATNSTSWSLLSKPALSAAALTHTNGLIAQLRPDVAGIYVIRDNVTSQTLTNTAATWMGYQAAGVGCANCHGPGGSQDDMVTPWSQTGHATMAQRGVDGIVSSYYSASCFQCHTTGFNQSPAASSNGNFYAVQQQVGWAFPTVLQAGNFAAMPADLQNKANIQCENCHGPGSAHPGSRSNSLDEKVCASCHQDGSHHFRPQQWEISPHSGGFENISNSRGTNPLCSRCHSPVGYTAIAKGTANVGTTNSVPTGKGPLTCQTCHDPHDTFGNSERRQLRNYDTALFGNPYFRSNTVTIALGESITTADLRLTNSNLIVTGLGNAATCITCHNGRQLPMQTVIYGTNTVLSAKMLRPTTVGTSKYYQVGGPHDQTAGEALLGVGMFDYGQVMGNSFHTYLADCQTCHMYLLRAPSGGVAQDTIAIDDVATPLATTALYKQFVNVLGDHTYKLDYQYVDTNGVQHVADNIAACNQCHASFEPVDSFDFKASTAQDYDGNSVIEGVQTETQGMLNNLGFLLKTTGVTITTNASGQVTSVSTSAGYSTNNVALAEAQYKAAWNFLAVYREGSFGVHNTQYTTRLLQTSYTDLSTNFTGNAAATYQNAFPEAYLR